LSDLLLERPEAVMWPSCGGGPVLAVQRSRLTLKPTVRRLFLPQQITQQVIKESHLTVHHTHPPKTPKTQIRNSKSETRNPKLETRNSKQTLNPKYETWLRLGLGFGASRFVSDFVLRISDLERWPAERVRQVAWRHVADSLLVASYSGGPACG
jgi:hypothetical protein